MKKKLKTILNYITRGWRDEPPPHPQLKIIPPFLFEALSYFILFTVIVALLKHLFI